MFHSHMLFIGMTAMQLNFIGFKSIFCLSMIVTSLSLQRGSLLVARQSEYKLLIIINHYLHLCIGKSDAFDKDFFKCLCQICYFKYLSSRNYSSPTTPPTYSSEVPVKQDSEDTPLMYDYHTWLDNSATVLLLDSCRLDPQWCIQAVCLLSQNSLCTLAQIHRWDRIAWLV